ncbi:MAG: hypothetical protein QXT64_00830 [Desulfurococcaceae archaeon]
MSYEYIHPYVELLRQKPLRADNVMKLVEEAGLKPIAVRVDNATGQLFIYFDKPLSREEKEKLDKLVEKLFREWK